MATLSSPGIGSGLDIKSIVSQLVALERVPVTKLETKGAALQTKLSAYGQVKASLAALDDASTALIDSTTWKARTFTSNNTTAVTGSATSTALASSFAVQVSALAQVQSLKSNSVVAGSAVGADGRLDIQAGQWTGVSFDGGSNATFSVSIAATDTLTNVASKINSAGAGVSAVVVTSGGLDRLLIRGNSTGNANGFKIDAFDSTSTPITDGATGVGAYAYSVGGFPATMYGMAQTQAAQNAALTIDGISISSASNTVSDAVPGITLNLQATTTTAAQVTVGVDKEVIKTKLESFRTAYNDIRTKMAGFMLYNPATKTGGPLLGDNTALNIEKMLRDMVSATGPAASTIGRLSDMGIQIQRDGTLATNTTKLDNALQDVANVQAFLTTSTGTSSTDGIARRLRDFVKGLNNIDGNVTGRNTALQNAITRNSKDIDTMNARVTRTEARLYAQYGRLDSSLSSINGMGSFMSSQIAQWNKTG